MGPIEVIREEGFTFAMWLVRGFVCSNLPRLEVERKVAQHKPGTTHGWRVEEGCTACEEQEDYVHYQVVC